MNIPTHISPQLQTRNSKTLLWYSKISPSIQATHVVTSKIRQTVPTANKQHKAYLTPPKLV